MHLQGVWAEYRTYHVHDQGWATMLQALILIEMHVVIAINDILPNCCKKSGIAFDAVSEKVTYIQHIIRSRLHLCEIKVYNKNVSRVYGLFV